MTRQELKQKIQKELDDSVSTAETAGRILELNYDRILWARTASQKLLKGDNIGVELDMKKLSEITQKIDKLKSNF